MQSAIASNPSLCSHLRSISMPKPNAAAIAAQNKRKIEKDKRRKHYHDSQVQGTNNSSIVSKRSVEVLYNPVVEPETKEWFKHFVPKGKRRSPAINRGYWLRMESIKQAVLRIQAAHGSRVRIVNLGCGFDPFPFQMLAENSIECEFFDFDYPELVQRKLALMKDSPEIMEVIGPVVEQTEAAKKMGVILATDTYSLVGCDLKNCKLYEEQLHTLLDSSDGPVIFIAEVSLAYMKPEHANPVVEILSRLPNSHILVLEQIMPSGDKHFFAQKMLYHFQHLTSPLQCVKTYSTKDLQKKRFQQYFPVVEVIDLFESWKQLVSPEKKTLVETVEEFDEWEEFIVFCQHYVVIHATNSSHSIFNESDSIEDPPVSGSLNIRATGELDLKFPAAASGSHGTYVHGGMFQTRSGATHIVDDEGRISLTTTDGPEPRMCHTLTNLGNGNLVLIGGRSRPGHDYNDVWIFDEQAATWSLIGSLPQGVSRHEAVALGEKSVLLLNKDTFFKIEIFDLIGNVRLDVQQLSVTGACLPSLSSCGMVYDVKSKKGFVIGGLTDKLTPQFNSTLYEFTITPGSLSILPVMQSPHFERVGCLVKRIAQELIIIGGVGPIPQNRATTTLRINLDTQSITALQIPVSEWEAAPVFIGLQLAGDVIVGGGTVCYSFGSHYNKVYKIDFSLI